MNSRSPLGTVGHSDRFVGRLVAFTAAGWFLLLLIFTLSPVE